MERLLGGGCQKAGRRGGTGRGWGKAWSRLGKGCEKARERKLREYWEKAGTGLGEGWGKAWRRLGKGYEKAFQFNALPVPMSSQVYFDAKTMCF